MVAVAKEVIQLNRFPKKSICSALGISRASVYKSEKVTSMAFYRKADDDLYLPLIRKVIEKRPSYGYKRLTALVNGILKAEGKDTVNRKRMYRLMKIHGLILPRSGDRRVNHEGTGQVMTLHFNTRWCSDDFEIECWNGEKVFVAFSFDCCDREAIHFVSAVTPLTQQKIAELIMCSADKRFSSGRSDRTIQWLTDRGSIYRAHFT
ncbi:MAG: hypothetical protein EOO45_00155 [Flavobacterium sp.]|nr:MAG: hypothetical protein EOO45_00155 [Flavobacterium sp.]